MAEEEADAAAFVQPVSPDKTHLPESVAFYWTAWQNLRYDRHVDSQTGWQSPISFLAYDAYARRYGLDGVEFENYLILVQAMDDEWLRFVEEKRAEDQKRREYERDQGGR